MAIPRQGESAELPAPLPEGPVKESVLRRKVRNAWRISRCWARYVLFGSRRGVPGLMDFIFGNHFFPAVQEREELSALGEILAARPPERALEIGRYLGGTLLFLTRLATPRATIISVDMPGGKFGGEISPGRAWAFKHLGRGRQRLEILHADSHSAETLNRVKAVLGGQALDYLFIDGDHTYEGVKSDFEIYAPLVGKGGMIVFHDIVEGPPERVGGVPRFWSEIKPQYRHQEIIRASHKHWCGIGLLYVD